MPRATSEEGVAHTPKASGAQPLTGSVSLVEDLRKLKAQGPGAPALSAEEQAKRDLNDALADLADIFGKPARFNIVPEQEQKLLPVLTRVFDAAFRLGYHKFKAAARFVRDTEKLGKEVADQLLIDHYQAAYIAMAHRYPDADSKRDVIAVESLKEE